MALDQVDREDDLKQGSPHAEEEVQPVTDRHIAPTRGAFGPRQEHRSSQQGSHRAGLELGDQRLT